MVRHAHPKRHRLEACATNTQAGSLRYQCFAEQFLKEEKVSAKIP